eukprot:GDKJ01028938.1.p1 GENE.GDKJ01028938.1~~GDKJ01028938.1.p1  ORF type:complete len:517 (-),score=139.00 GDKJ01028938.1:352-1812(-)
MVNGAVKRSIRQRTLDNQVRATRRKFFELKKELQETDCFDKNEMFSHASIAQRDILFSACPDALRLSKITDEEFSRFHTAFSPFASVPDSRRFAIKTSDVPQTWNLSLEISGSPRNCIRGQVENLSLPHVASSRDRLARSLLSKPGDVCLPVALLAPSSITRARESQRAASCDLSCEDVEMKSTEISSSTTAADLSQNEEIRMYRLPIVTRPSFGRSLCSSDILGVSRDSLLAGQDAQALTASHIGCSACQVAPVKPFACFLDDAEVLSEEEDGLLPLPRLSVPQFSTCARIQQGVEKVMQMVGSHNALGGNQQTMVLPSVAAISELSKSAGPFVPKEMKSMSHTACSPAKEESEVTSTVSTKDTSVAIVSSHYSANKKAKKHVEKIINEASVKGLKAVQSLASKLNATCVSLPSCEQKDPDNLVKKESVGIRDNKNEASAKSDATSSLISELDEKKKNFFDLLKRVEGIKKTKTPEGGMAITSGA